MSWGKEPGRLDRRRLKRATVSPEDIGLCGCWQVIAVRRERVELGPKAAPPSDEIGYYAARLAPDPLADAGLLQAIRGHWDAIEHGPHPRRDVSFGEDARRVSQRGAAQILAALRNLALGRYELEKERGRTDVAGVKSWGRQMTASTALALLSR